MFRLSFPSHPRGKDNFSQCLQQFAIENHFLCIQNAIFIFTYLGKRILLIITQITLRILIRATKCIWDMWIPLIHVSWYVDNYLYLELLFLLKLSTPHLIFRTAILSLLCIYEMLNIHLRKKQLVGLAGNKNKLLFYSRRTSFSKF